VADLTGLSVADNPVKSATTFSRVAAELKASYPSIDEVCRINKCNGNVMVNYNGNVYREENVMGADSSFFSLFNFKFLFGDPAIALKHSRSVVITSSMAEKYFGSKNPMGEQLVIDGAFGFWSENGYNSKITYKVTGVLEDLPENTHLSFDFLISYNMYNQLERELNNWGDSFYTYFNIKDQNEIASVTTGLSQIIDKYKANQGVSLDTQPMQRIHLESKLMNEITPNSDSRVGWLLAAVAIIILIIAGTNYINFSTAKAVNRQKEIEIRKVFWAKRSDLFLQFITEALVLNVISLLLAILLIFLSKPLLINSLGFSTSGQFTKPEFFLFTGFTLVIAVMLSGIYPALHLSGLGLRRVVSTAKPNAERSAYFRKFLITFQYAISMLVIGCATVLYFQMDLIKHKDLGMDIERTLVVNGPSFNKSSDSLHLAKLAIFKEEALRLNSIKGITLANFIPGKEIRGAAKGYVRRIGEPENQVSSYFFTQIDYDFIPNFDFKLVAGRNFNPTLISDRMAIVINRETCRQLGFNSPEDAIGQQIVYRMNSTPTIIGVVDNFHQYSLKTTYQPIIFEARRDPSQFCFLKLTGNTNLSEIDQLNDVWDEVFPGNPFNFFLLDDFYSRQYNSDREFMNAFTVFAALAIIIAALGIFGLTYYTAENKIKEIGIRKTLGANIWSIFVIFGKNLAFTVLLAAVIGIPSVFLISEHWLLNYAFRIDVSWWMLAAPFLLLLLISTAIVLLQSIRSFKLNPTLLLREE